MIVCAIVPSHNHWQALGQVVAALRAARLPVFIIDDGSGPAAAAAIAALHDPAGGVEVHRFEVNQGKGAAVIEGFRRTLQAGFTHAVQVDADGQHDLHALPRLLARAAAHPGALVSGQPIFDETMRTNRKVGRWITHVWVWIETLSLTITDSMCPEADHSRMRMGSTDAECTIACVSVHHATYVLYDGKDAYTLSDQTTPGKFAGR